MATNPANPVGKLTAKTSDDDNRWVISGIPAAIGVYDCKREGSETVIQLFVGGTPMGTHATGGNCRIQVTSVTANSIEGRFSALLINAGNSEGTVVDGYFRKSVPGGEEPDELPSPNGDGAALNGANGFTLTVNGATHTVLAADNPLPMAWQRIGSGAGTTYTFNAESMFDSDIPQVVISKLPSTGAGAVRQPALGSFACNTDTDNGEPAIRLQLRDNDGTMYSTDAMSFGAACTIEIIEATTTTVTGRFSALFTSNKGPTGATYAVSDGYFRLQP